MMTTHQAEDMALALPGSQMRPHFGSAAFFVDRIFATVWHDQRAVNLNLSAEEQSRFVLTDGEGFTPLDNAWGRRGWTRVDLEFVDLGRFEEALKCAWAHATKKTQARTKAIRKRR